MPAPSTPGGDVRGWTGAILPVAAGLLLALSFPPLPLPLLAFFALAPLALVVERAPPGPAGGVVALRAGLLAGALSWALLLHWIPMALFPVAPVLAFPVWVATVGFLAALTGAACRGALALRRGGVPGALALPLAWTAVEWARGQAGILAIPWLPLGGALAPLPAWAAPAEVVGVHGLTFWAAVVACGAVGLVVGSGTASASAGGAGAAVQRHRAAALLALLFLLPPFWGWWRNRELDLRPVAEVAAVQLRLHLAPGTPADPVAVTRALIPLLGGLPGGGATDLILLPEAAVDAMVSPGGPLPDPLPLLLATAGRTGARLIVGGYAPAPSPHPRGSALNAALLLHPDGSMEVVHGKRYLVPGIERGLPPPLDRLPGGRRLAEGGMVPGGPSGRVALPGGEAGVLICYETAFSAAARVPRRDGAGVLLALTHEGWFGREGSAARAQHIAHLRMRSVETRAGSLRAAMDGEALLVDPLGRVVARGGDAEAALVRGTLHTVDGVPVHVRTGDVVGAGAFLVSLLLLLAGWRRGADSSHGRG
jgi:apolipoprotein N-acyltransferase